MTKHNFEIIIEQSVVSQEEVEKKIFTAFEYLISADDIININNNNHEKH